jgi:hypothetical protein
MAWQNKGRQTVTYLTINGRVEIDRGLYRRKDRGPLVPTDAFLGIGSSCTGPGVRELTCREAMSSSFHQAAEDLDRMGQ